MGKQGRRAGQARGPSRTVGVDTDACSLQAESTPSRQSDHGAGRGELDVALGRTSFHFTPGKVRAAKSKQVGGSLWGARGPQQSLARPSPKRGALSVCPLAIGVSLHEKFNFKSHSLETVFSYLWTQVPTCLQTHQTGGFPIHPLCLAPLPCAPRQVGCVSALAHMGGPKEAHSPGGAEGSPAPQLCVL